MKPVPFRGKGGRERDDPLCAECAKFGVRTKVEEGKGRFCSFHSWVELCPEGVTWAAYIATAGGSFDATMPPPEIMALGILLHGNPGRWIPADMTSLYPSMAGALP